MQAFLSLVTSCVATKCSRSLFWGGARIFLGDFSFLDHLSDLDIFVDGEDHHFWATRSRNDGLLDVNMLHDVDNFLLLNYLPLLLLVEEECSSQECEEE
ncbi:hypothetical protein B296_00001247 [Ensete ventricosum]|uniref:Uncharacterized protein n=1 Tax=Ensete ventricosum TaxID=4639 RepID=A0A427B1B7_ENSVE|nr:hypothetical protein B296_00001247 [Ensete ventricosum]